MKNSNQKSKKVPLIIGTVGALIVAVGVGAFAMTGKPGEKNEDVNLNETKTTSIEHKLEYGENIEGKTFTVNSKVGAKEVNFTDLQPDVDTMNVGKTEHELKVEKESFDVTVTVEDTKKPVIEGVQETITLEGENVNVEESLKGLIKANDPVDGELEVNFAIEADKVKENIFNVTATAADKNGNETTKNFKVVVKTSAEKDEEKIDDKVATNPGTTADKKPNVNNNNSSTNNNKGNTNNNTSTPKQETPKPQPKPEPKPQPKPEPKPQPKPEPKPQPKPEPKPQPNPGYVYPDEPIKYEALKTPSGLPSGATLTSSEASYHKYSYSYSLPDGGSISTVAVTTQNGKTVDMRGKDRYGKNFTVSYVIARGVLQFSFSDGNFSEADLTIFEDLGYTFARAYGLK